MSQDVGSYSIRGLMDGKQILHLLSTFSKQFFAMQSAKFIDHSLVSGGAMLWRMQENPISNFQF